METTEQQTEPNDRLNELSGHVIGAAIEVHQQLGPGFLEAVYEEAVCVEFDRCDIPYRRQVATRVDYKGHRIAKPRVDLVVGDDLLVELKAVENVKPIHRATIMSYLKATELQLGLLLNFKTDLLKNDIERLVWTDD